MSTKKNGALGDRAQLDTASGSIGYYPIHSLVEAGLTESIDKLPFTVRILLENVLRNLGGEFVDRGHVEGLAAWKPGASRAAHYEVPFLPARVVLQDFTGVPCVVDLASMRTAMAELGGDVAKINPLVPVDLVIDHSVQVDRFGTLLAFNRNVEFEYERNSERYALLRWAQKSFGNFRVVPPGTGIVHQVNLEYLGSVVERRGEGKDQVALPDTLVGTDSHTTMINGLGILGWGVGGIEAEAVMLGQPLYLLPPEVVGFQFNGKLREGVTATDLVLAVTEQLRAHGVVGRFVEYCGTGLSSLSLADRATLANMSPEYGATAGLFPVDDETLRYLHLTGRSDELIDLVERYCKAQGLFRADDTPVPEFDELLELDLDTVQPSVAGPRRPQDRVALGDVRRTLRTSFAPLFPHSGDLVDPIDMGVPGGTNYDEQSAGSFPASDPPSAMAGGNGEDQRYANQPAKSTNTIWTQFEHTGTVPVTMEDGVEAELHHGAIAIAAITSCTNTSNPSVMLGAGLLAKKAVERGLDVAPYVKTSMAPGSQVVTRYLDHANVTPYLEALGFHTVGYGCTTCIGNSGPLPEPVAKAVDENDLVVAAVLSGNRNFEGRIHSQVRASFLASPPLVVAYALAGTVDIDLTKDPLGYDPNGEAVYLRDIWPTRDEIKAVMDESVDPQMFREEYATVFEGDDRWRALPVPEGQLYDWHEDSTYVQNPPYFEGMAPQPEPLKDITGARVLALLGNSVTTDHISPAGAIARTSPAGNYLVEKGVRPVQFNSYGSRRGNHEVMIRGTFANIRLRNLLTPDKEGNWTKYLPTGEEMSIYDAAEKYIADGTPLLVIAGKEYGTGSSRDWAAKGTLLLGVQAVIAESFERIHRSNLVGMGVLPLQFANGQNAQSLGITGEETFTIKDLETTLKPKATMQVTATRPDGSTFTFDTVARVDSNVDVDYFRNGGILPAVLRKLVQA